MSWVAGVVRRHGVADRPTLEVGSYDENGSVRSLFSGPYLGVDMRDGPGVDRVEDAEDLGLVSRFGVVVSTETLEHCRRPWKAIHGMSGVLDRGGLLILTARGYDRRGTFPIHDFPSDLWRFSGQGMCLMVTDAGLTVDEWAQDPEAPGVFLTAHKGD